MRPLPRNAEAARLRLDDGNRAFASLFDRSDGPGEPIRHVIPVDACDVGLMPVGMGTPAQRPYAAVLGCADARVPIELIFTEGPNDLFVVRIAGNGLGADTLGSLVYAIEHLRDSLKVVVVLGHSGCGAVCAAVDIFLQPASYLPLATSHALRNVLDRLLVVVQASSRKLLATYGTDVAHRPRYREALVEASIATNAALAAHMVQQELNRGRPSGLRAMYGVYLIGTRRIWAPRCGELESSGLADAPQDVASFAVFGDAVARSDRIASLLKST